MTLLLSMPGGSEWILILLSFGLVIIPAIFYILTLQKTLEIISPENRKMPPTYVWLLLVPLLGLIWHFIVVRDLSASIKAEAISKDLNVELKPAYNIGLAMCILSCLFLIPILSIFTNIAFLVCWIIYWLKINSYKKMLSGISY